MVVVYTIVRLWLEGLCEDGVHVVVCRRFCMVLLKMALHVPSPVGPVLAVDTDVRFLSCVQPGVPLHLGATLANIGTV